MIAPSDLNAFISALIVSVDGPSVNGLAVLGLGFYLGARHALDADHLVAVSTFIGERHSFVSSLLLGGLWGLGHTLSLLAVGLVVVFFNVRLPDRIALGMELLVALMLIGLGINALLRNRKGAAIHWHSHAHGGHVHAHPHVHKASNQPEHLDSPLIPAESSETHHGLEMGLKPLFVGLVHGLAGSAALMLIVLSTIQSRGLAIAYILVFGVGSIGGMALISSLISLPLRMTIRRFEGTEILVRALAGFLSLGFGIFLAAQVGRHFS